MSSLLTKKLSDMPQRRSSLQHEFLQTNKLKAETSVVAMLQTNVCEDNHKKYPFVKGRTSVIAAQFSKSFTVKSDEYCCKAAVTTGNTSKPQPVFCDG